MKKKLYTAINRKKIVNSIFLNHVLIFHNSIWMIQISNLFARMRKYSYSLFHLIHQHLGHIDCVLLDSSFLYLKPPQLSIYECSNSSLGVLFSICLWVHTIALRGFVLLYTIYSVSTPILVESQLFMNNCRVFGISIISIYESRQSHNKLNLFRDCWIEVK